MEREFGFHRRLFPSLGAEFDIAAGLQAYDATCLASPPDAGRFPETRGLWDRARGEREGFLESSGFTALHAAYHYLWGRYVWRHLNARHVARYDLAGAPTQCSNVYFAEGRDGVTVADNRDDVLYPWFTQIPSYRPRPLPANRRPGWLQGKVSSAVLLDEEPECPFPYDAAEFVPAEARGDIRALVAYMDERRDFWGPGNQIWVDGEGRAVAVEKANVRAAYRFAGADGATCITAGSYLDEGLNAYKRSRLEEAARRSGRPIEDSLDLLYAEGCDARHRRLWELTRAEAARPGGATLWGAFGIVADTAVPFPARICLAGEKADEREQSANWTVTQQATVVTGPHRRGLYRSIQSLTTPRPITEETPKLMLGEGVALQAEWAADVAAGRCELR